MSACLPESFHEPLTSQAHTPANTRLISNTRTPANGNFFAFGAVANPRMNLVLPGRAKAGAARIAEPVRDNQKPVMRNGIVICPLD